jgi:3-phosphoshikimate 1-carboxyvinyltransferase
MLASISEGTTHIKNLLIGDDVLHTIEAFRAMGVNISVKCKVLSVKGRTVVVHGVGMHGLKKPRKSLYLGNSGTTMRLLPGILAGQDFAVVLKGDASLLKRPMKRIVEPLARMGANISGEGLRVPVSSSWRGLASGGKGEIYPPLRIKGGRLKAIDYKSKIASAQVKSCILLAGLFADGVTSVTEPVKSRDHTERMLRMFGCRLKAQGSRVSLKGPVKLKSPGAIEIPGDISSAAFFIVAGCILPNTKIIVRDVGLNPTRTGVLDILKRMGADISVKCKVLSVKGGQPTGDIVVKSSKIKGVVISPEEVVRAIDEIPIIMVAACFARGTTNIRGIEELRVKETDRIKSMVTNLRKLGADIDVVFEAKPRTSDVRGLASNIIRVKGGRMLHGGRVSSFGDHRTAMSMLVAGLAVKGNVSVIGIDCINKSFPGFQHYLYKVLKT